MRLKQTDSSFNGSNRHLKGGKYSTIDENISDSNDKSKSFKKRKHYIKPKRSPIKGYKGKLHEIRAKSELSQADRLKKTIGRLKTEGNRKPWNMFDEPKPDETNRDSSPASTPREYNYTGTLKAYRDKKLTNQGFFMQRYLYDKFTGKHGRKPYISTTNDSAVNVQIRSDIKNNQANKFSLKIARNEIDTQYTSFVEKKLRRTHHKSSSNLVTQCTKINLTKDSNLPSINVIQSNDQSMLHPEGKKSQELDKKNIEIIKESSD